MRREDLADEDCGIAQSLGVLGDWWTFLIVRDVAGGVTRFDALQRELGISRRALTERLAGLVADGVLSKEPYSTRPPRHDYVLTPKGQGLLPVLVALQDWGARHVLGDGSVSAGITADSAESRRVGELVGHALPPITLTRHDGIPVGLSVSSGPGSWTVLFCMPGAWAPAAQGYSPGWGEIPGAAGCTVEAMAYAAQHAAFAARGVVVHGVSTQRPDQQAAFAEHASLPYVLLSDEDVALAGALRLPTFRAGGVDRLKRVTLVVDPAGVVRAVQAPVTDPAGSAVEMLGVLDGLMGGVANSA
ncbi:winged helix-turn-helix transcriptional regulator [Knoellia sp. CPCC 206453]|uniref:winged helix-turn-helix transcriptional regulator n=1 Tax=Knoellia pratensis TaxID=3404796 RepID=UPI00360D6A14